MTGPRLVVLSGPAGVGKTTVRQRLLEDARFAFSVSATTRPPRPGETDGVDYHYLSPEEFERRVAAGLFLEHAEFCGNRYGTLRSEVDKTLAEGRIPLLEIDVQGAEILRQDDQPTVSVFIEPPSLEELENRIRGRRTEDEESTQRRLRRAREELARASLYDVVVVNHDVDRCVDEIRTELLGRFGL